MVDRNQGDGNENSVHLRKYPLSRHLRLVDSRCFWTSRTVFSTAWSLFSRAVMCLSILFDSWSLAGEIVNNPISPASSMNAEKTTRLDPTRRWSNLRFAIALFTIEHHSKHIASLCLSYVRTVSFSMSITVSIPGTSTVMIFDARIAANPAKINRIIETMNSQ